LIPDEGLQSYIHSNGNCRHIILIDPAEQEPEIAANRALIAIEEGSKMIFIGGSTDTPNEIVHSTCLAIQEALELRVFAASQHPDQDEDQWKIPVILFPGGAHAISPAADGIIFIMLMNSKSRKWLIGEQLLGAPHLLEYGIEPISTGYILCYPGGKVGEIGQAELIMSDETSLIKNYVITAKMYGMSTIYLEAGSGATSPVSKDLIQSAAEIEDLTLIVGGGIKDAKSAATAAIAGADWIVTGSITEDLSDNNQLRQLLKEVISAI
jgi:phosphoglycerol geranylgeranyltransferase